MSHIYLTKEENDFIFWRMTECQVDGDKIAGKIMEKLDLPK